jgi:hypothetical protein
MGVRATARLTSVDRGTVASLALRVGRGCAELHGVRVARIEIDEAWSFVSKSASNGTKF